MSASGEISPHWSEGETLFFLRANFPFLKKYKDNVFDGVDGRVLLGITDTNARRIFGEELAERDVGLLLAKLNFFRSSVVPPPTVSRHSALPDQADSPDELRSPQIVPAAGLPSGGAPPTRVDPRRESAVPIGGGGREEDEASLLVEVWDTQERFMGETWLPGLSMLATKEKTEHKLQLRRTFSASEIARSPLIAPKPFLFGALKIRARYAQNCVVSDCKQETSGGTLYVTILDCLMYRGAISDALKFKIYVLPPTVVSEQIRQVYESRASEVSNSLCVWDEDLELHFLGVDAWRKKIAASDDVLMAARADTALSEKTGEAMGPRLEELRDWAMREQWFMFHPRYSRYDAAVFPIHEATACSGEAHMLRSSEETKTLRKSPSFMARFKDALNLVLLSWGFSPEGSASTSATRRQSSGGESGKRWMDHSWRLRHLLLSCMLLEYRQGLRTLVEVFSTLLRRRRVNIEETGEGEGIFTLGEEEGRKWFKTKLRSYDRSASERSHHSWPRRGASLEELVRIAKSNMN
jgi:hypothetical protein